MQKRGDRRYAHFKIRVINVRSLVSKYLQSLLITTFLSKPYRKRQSEPTGDTEARRKREAKAQLNAKLSQPRKQTQGERMELRPRQLYKRQAESTHVGSRLKERVAKAQADKRQSEIPCLCVPVQKKTKYGYVEDVNML